MFLFNSSHLFDEYFFSGATVTGPVMAAITELAATLMELVIGLPMKSAATRALNTTTGLCHIPTDTRPMTYGGTIINPCYQSN